MFLLLLPAFKENPKTKRAVNLAERCHGPFKNFSLRSIIHQRLEPAVTPDRRTQGSYDKRSGSAEIRSFLNPYKKVYILNLEVGRANVNGNFRRTVLNFCFRYRDYDQRKGPGSKLPEPQTA